MEDIVNRYFTPVAFNLWDKNDPNYNQAMHRWSAGLRNSPWGYVRIVSVDGKEIVAGTGEITSGRDLPKVLAVLKEAMEALDIDIPDDLASY